MSHPSEAGAAAFPIVQKQNLVENVEILPSVNFC